MYLHTPPYPTPLCPLPILPSSAHRTTFCVQEVQPKVAPLGRGTHCNRRLQHARAIQPKVGYGVGTTRSVEGLEGCGVWDATPLRGVRPDHCLSRLVVVPCAPTISMICCLLKQSSENTKLFSSQIGLRSFTSLVERGWKC